MWKYIVKRLLLGVVTVLIVSFLMYLLLYTLPEKPYAGELRGARTDVDRARIIHKWGADQPFIVQYTTFLKNASKPLWTWVTVECQDPSAVDVKHCLSSPHAPEAPDLGYSVVLKKTTMQAIWERVPATLVLMGFSYLVQLLIAIPIGIVSAVKQYGKLDNFVTSASFFGISLPNFWFGAMLIYALALPHGRAGYFPVGNVGQSNLSPDNFHIVPGDLLWHLILPTVVLAVQGVAVYARYVRSSMLDVLSQDYIRTARAKGLPARRIIMRHAFRNSLLPLITLVGLDLPQLFVGAVITEYVFNWPGLGRRFVEAAGNVDVPILMGILVVLSILVVIGNLITDLVYTWADPRISYEGAT